MRVPVVLIWGVFAAKASNAELPVEETLASLIAKYEGSEASALFTPQVALLQSLQRYRQNAKASSGTPAPSEGPKPPSPESRLAWSGAGDLATYLGAKDEPAPTINLRVDIVFVGLDGENGCTGIDHAMLENWFEPIAPEISHIAAAHACAAAPEELHARGNSGGGAKCAAVDTGVRYLYSFHVIEVGPAVLDAVESSMRIGLRRSGESVPGNNASSGASADEGVPSHYISSWSMENLLASLQREVSFVHVETPLTFSIAGGTVASASEIGPPPAYTLFVLNPRRAKLGPGAEAWRYGYRWGFGYADMAALAADPQAVQMAEDAEAADDLQRRVFADGVKGRASGITEVHASARSGSGGGPSSGQMRKRRCSITWVDATEVTQRWALRALKDINRVAHRSVKKEYVALAADAGFAGRRDLLRDVLEFRRGGGGVSGGHAGPTKEREGELGSDTWSPCLSELWVGSGRFAWLDLQAGPFDWGATGGEGVKPSAAIPRAPSCYKSGDAVAETAGSDEAEIGREVARLAGLLLANRQRVEALAGQLKCSKSPGSRRSAPAGRSAAASSAGGRQGACASLNEQLLLLRACEDGVAAVAAGETSMTAGALPGNENGNVLPALLEAKSMLAALLEAARRAVAPATGDDGNNATSADGVSTFLKQIAALVASLARNVITPVSALPPTFAESLADSAGSSSGAKASLQLPLGAHILDAALTGPVAASPPLPEALPAVFLQVPTRLTVTLYVVRVQSEYAPLDGGGRGGGAFDLLAFQRQVMALKLPAQDASLTVHDVDLSDDAALAAAFFAARRDVAVTVASAIPGAPPKSVVRRSIDSATLARHLRGASYDGGFASGGGSGLGSTKTASFEEAANSAPAGQLVDVFLFSVDGATPSYVDAHWQARAVSPDLVVAVQSAPLQAEAPLRCHGRPLHYNPRNPLRAVVAAVAELIGGLVPMHIGPCGLGGSSGNDSMHPGGTGADAMKDFGGYDARNGILGDISTAAHHYHDSMCQDWTWAISESALSALVPHARLGQLQREDIPCRTHAARALAASSQMTSAAVQRLSGVAATSYNEWLADGAMDDLSGRLKRDLEEVKRLRWQLTELVERMDLAGAVAAAAPLLERSKAVLALAVAARGEIDEALSQEARGHVQEDVLELALWGLSMIFGTGMAVLAGVMLLLGLCPRRRKGRLK